MVISFTGAQSTGKSTLLNHLFKCNGAYPFEFVPEVTRLVMREYDMLINEQGGDMTQLLIMTEHVRNIYRNRADKIIRRVHTVLDRCALDGIVYSDWLYKKGKITQNCFECCKLIYDELRDQYDVIFYTDPKNIELTSDGQRSTNKDFREEIIYLFEQYLEFYPGKVVVLSGTVESRLEQIKNTLANEQIDIKI